jgi:hypothetical protein
VVEVVKEGMEIVMEIVMEVVVEMEVEMEVGMEVVQLSSELDIPEDSVLKCYL